MRLLNEVIDAILLEIPTWEKELKLNLLWLKDDFNYKPPEQWSADWAMGAKFIQRAIPTPPVADWQWTVISIWMDKTIDELKAIFK